MEFRVNTPTYNQRRRRGQQRRERRLRRGVGAATMGRTRSSGSAIRATEQAWANEFQVNTYNDRRTSATRRSAATRTGTSSWCGRASTRTAVTGIFGSATHSSGVALDEEFRVNIFTTSLQRGPAVSSDVNGDFVVVWNSRVQDGDAGGIFGRRYVSSGAAQGGEFPVNTHTTSYQTHASASSAANGDFVVVWTRATGDVPQGDNQGVFGQRFGLRTPGLVPSSPGWARWTLALALLLAAAALLGRRTASGRDGSRPAA